MPAGFALSSNGKVAANLSGAPVLLFDNATGPLLYASITRTNAVVRYEGAGEASSVISLPWNGTAVTTAGVPGHGDRTRLSRALPREPWL
jgi:hypothetical protein